MDDIDLLTERDERLMEALRAVRKPEGPQATGACLSCEEPLEDQRRWCDADCRDDFELHTQRTTHLHR